MVPRVVVAGTQSGVGKTTIATGLMSALRRRGLAVAGFKVGPDFIDPTYHSIATGRPGRNLDAFLSSESLIAPLFLHGAGGADIAVIEGVMGLFDGKTGAGELASTAQIAKLVGAPVLLVLDVSAVARSVAAVAGGFLDFDPDLQIAGLVLNRVGSEGHEAILREALAPLGVPVLGALRRRSDIGVQHRHLGLVPAAEQRSEALKTVGGLGEVVEASCDVKMIEAIAKGAASLPGAVWSPHGAKVRGARIAIATGPAFTFIYEENIELMRARGAELLSFDPTTDPSLPDGATALYLGGGFPEVFRDSLSANEPMRRQVKAFADSGRPVLAECGGFLYLCRELDGRAMCGVLPSVGTLTQRVKIGYRDAAAVSSSILASLGEAVRGHEFHYSVVEPPAGRVAAWDFGTHTDGFVHKRVHASYLHTHWASDPTLADAFVHAAGTGDAKA